MNSPKKRLIRKSSVIKIEKVQDKKEIENSSISSIDSIDNSFNIWDNSEL
jgi:hypothetical protein